MATRKTTNTDVDLTMPPHPPISALDLRARTYAAELTQDRLLRTPWWQDADLWHRVAWTTGITAATIVVFAIGFIAGDFR